MAAKRILAILSASLIPVQALPSFLNSPPVIQPYTGSPRPSPRRLVDKFAQDTDGKWRKVEDFELYGNRICVVRTFPVYLYNVLTPFLIFLFAELRP